MSGPFSRQRTIQCRDDALGQGPVQSERVSDREDILSDQQVAACAYGTRAGAVKPAPPVFKKSKIVLSDEDFTLIHRTMKRASEHSGHDQAKGRQIDMPTKAQMQADLLELTGLRTTRQSP